MHAQPTWVVFLWHDFSIYSGDLFSLIVRQYQTRKMLKCLYYLIAMNEIICVMFGKWMAGSTCVAMEKATHEFVLLTVFVKISPFWNRKASSQHIAIYFTLADFSYPCYIDLFHLRGSVHSSCFRPVSNAGIKEAQLHFQFPSKFSHASKSVSTG